MYKNRQNCLFPIAVHCVLLLSFFAGEAPAQSSSAGARANSLSVSPRLPFKGSVHPLAAPANDRGLAPDSLPMSRMLLLLQRSAAKEAALQKLLEEQQTKGSTSYHHWLSPEDFGAQFGPDDQEVGQVTAWLASQGLHVNRISAGKTVIEFSGTAAQVRSAFQTEIHKYAVAGKEYWANSQDPTIPAALGRLVGGIVSLHNFPTPSEQRRQAVLSAVSGGNAGLHPDFTYPSSGCSSIGNCYGVVPADFATIYDVGPLWTAGIDGSLQTIAIASGSNIRLTDVQHFRQLFNLPTNDPSIFVDGTDPGIVPVEELETNFSVQWTGAVAKNAKIQLVVAQSTATSRGTDLAALYIVDNNLAPILMESLSDCEDDLGTSGTVFYSSLWQQAAAEGITVVIPTGDTGSAACDSSTTEVAAHHGIAVNGVASTAYNVAVGGTDFNQVGNWAQYWNSSNDPSTFASAKSYIPETTWNDTCTENGLNGCQTVSPSGSDLIAGGGGLSKYTQQPIWQMVGSAPLQGARGIPDVSLFAGDGNNGSFYIICQEDAQTGGPGCDLNAPYQDFATLGGTTGAAATFAGIMALVDQKTNSRQGNANFVIYPLAQSTTANAFHDVALGSISVACAAGTPYCSNTTPPGYGFLGDASNALWSAFPGYDVATGWGSVDANNLVTNWSSVSFLPTLTTINSLSPTSNLIHGQAVNFSIQVTQRNGSGTPTGDVALMVSPASGNPYAAEVFTLQGGSISGSTTFLPGGSNYQVFAHYAGDGTFAPSDSAAITISVGAEPSQTVLAVPTNAGGSLTCQTDNLEFFYGASYILYGIVNTSGIPCAGVNNSNPPTGTVTLTDNGMPLDAGTYTLNTRAHFEDAAASLSPGNHNIVGVYSGDSSYAASTSAPLSIFIDQAQPRVTLMASATSVIAGQNVTLTATLNTNSIAAPPSGTVSFETQAGVTLGTVMVIPSGLDARGFVQATATLNFVPQGTVIVFAQYNGDKNYFNGTSQNVTITAGSADYQVAAAPNPLIITAGQTGSATITVTPVFGYTGTVTLACPGTLPPGVTCVLSSSTITLGSDGKAGTSTVTFTTLAPSVIPNQMVQAVPLQESPAFVVSAAALLFSPFFFLLGGRRNRRAFLAISAAFIVFFAASCSSSVQNNSSTVLTLSSDGAKAAQGSPVTLRAFVSADHTVTGSVTFLDSNSQLGQPVMLAAGRASLTLSTLAIGTHAIAASYTGDTSTKAASTANPFYQVITGDSFLKISATAGNVSHPLSLDVTLK